MKDTDFILCLILGLMALILLSFIFRDFIRDLRQNDDELE